MHQIQQFWYTITLSILLSPAYTLVDSLAALSSLSNISLLHLFKLSLYTLPLYATGGVHSILELKQKIWVLETKSTETVSVLYVT